MPLSGFALPVALRGFGVKRIDRAIGRLEQLVDDGALTGFDDHRQGRITGGLLAPVLPAGGRVVKVEGGHDLAGGVKDDGMVLVLGPVDAGEVGEGRLGGNHSDLLVGGLGVRLRSPCLRFRPAST